MKCEEESNKQRFPNAFVFLAGLGEKTLPRGETINHITWKGIKPLGHSQSNMI